MIRRAPLCYTVMTVNYCRRPIDGPAYFEPSRVKPAVSKRFLIYEPKLAETSCAVSARKRIIVHIRTLHILRDGTEGVVGGWIVTETGARGVQF